MGHSGHVVVRFPVSFGGRTRKTTRIKFLTDGMLLAEAASDRKLSRYDAIIIDEAHERSLNIDFLLGIIKRLVVLRPDLKIIISSATLDTEKFSRHFDGAKVITIPGKTFPIEIRYCPTPEAASGAEPSIAEQTVAVVGDIVRHEPYGDILVFMATERDIVEVVESLDGAGDAGKNLSVLPLFGRLSGREQSRIFVESKQRKVVVATNVAETSITVPGIRYVVDSGQARISSYSPRARTTKLPVCSISRASADQRRGRCGRVGPGVCIRLYSEEDYLAREEFTPPEIVRANLADVILRMLDLRLGHPAKFPFLDPPHPRAVKDGIAVLRELSAVEESAEGPGFRLTKQGRLMARLPLDPCIARMVLEARDRRVLHPVMIIAAALSIQDPRIRPLGSEGSADTAHRQFVEPSSDFITLLNIWRHYHHVARTVNRSRLRKYCQQNFLGYQRMREWCDIYEQICHTLEENGNFVVEPCPGDHDAIHQSILTGIVRNIGFRKEKNLYQGAFGKEVMVFPGSGQFNKTGQWLMAAEMVETTRLYARTVATINPQWLERIAAGLCHSSYSDAHWEKKRGQVVALEKVTLFGLPLVQGRRVNYGPINPKEARQIFIQSALVEGEVSRDFDFLSRNQELIAELQEIEDRMRRRYLIDDYALANFYDQRLPDLVWDVASLVRVLPRVGAILMMTRDDLVADDPDAEQLEDFPSELTVGSFCLPLFYKFTPGTREDGVSVHIPVTALPHINPQIFDWLVPGLITEKITCLLRSLPKTIRKHLVPVNQTAADLFKHVDFGVGSLPLMLARLIEQQFGLVVAKEDWRSEELPVHLRMRFCLVSDDGCVIKHSRNFGDLFAVETRKDGGIPFADIRKQWERDGIAEYDDSIPSRIPVPLQAGALAGYAFPALVDIGGNRIGLRLFLSEEESRQKNQSGLRLLYERDLGPLVKRVAKDFALHQLDWSLFQWLGSLKSVNEQMQHFIITEICDLKLGLPSKEEFEHRLVNFADGEFYRQAGDIFTRVRNLLVERADTVALCAKFKELAVKSPYNVQRFKRYDEALAQLLPHDFLQIFDQGDLDRTPRYLKALRIRIERAHVAPGRDQEKEAQVAPFDAKVRELHDRLSLIAIPVQRQEAGPLVAEFIRMVDEFKVSVFAPEIKTTIPISVKRLEQKWLEINQRL
ncbi:MAG: ATP-dependent RNA helicase HrpA [Desulfobulbaceae bacterium]|nr:ATP-dependent RNA helicase HrpA [Desulfobulbaceae bacterium]